MASITLMTTVASTTKTTNTGNLMAEYSAWVGALTAGILFQLGAVAMGAYLQTSALASIYGATGSVLAVLLWAYYTAQTVLYGGEICHEHALLTTSEEDPLAKVPDNSK